MVLYVLEKKAQLEELSKNTSDRSEAEETAILSDTLVRSRQASYCCIRKIVYYLPQMMVSRAGQLFSDECNNLGSIGVHGAGQAEFGKRLFTDGDTPYDA